MARGPHNPPVSPRLSGRVLVVDDTEAKRYLIVQTLRLAGMEVWEAATGAEGLAAALRGPDVVVLDVRLPDMLGFEVCRQLKADPATAPIPVLYISATLRDDQLEARLFEDGADGYIPQPIEAKHLVAQTWALVRMRRAEQAREREREQARAEQRRLLARLESSEERLRLALEAARLGAWTYDISAGEFQADARAKELFGLPPDAPMSLRTWFEGTHPEDRDRVSRMARAAEDGEHGGVFHLEYRTVGLQDGGIERWISARGRVLFGPEGRPEQFSGIWLDITARKLDEQRAADLQAITAAFAHALTVKQVGDALMSHGVKSLGAYAGAVSLVEGEHLRVITHFGYPESALAQYAVFPLSLRTPTSDAAREGRTVWARDSEKFEHEWPEFSRTIQGSRTRTWLSTPLKEGERVVGVLGLSFSTSRRFTAQEQAYLESICQLSTQAFLRARLYEEERRAREEARQRAELEQQFLGMVSHDLRNPLQAISLGARSLQRMGAPEPDKLQRTAGRIVTSADTMGRMVSDLLDFTRGHLGGGIPLERKAGDLMGLCHEVIDEFSVTHPRIPIRLEGDATCEGQWDEPRMRQVLSNLLSNAVRYAREGSAVSVRASTLPHEVELSVSNEGPPIPEELLPVLFDPFRRGMARFKPSGSLGLGLYIVRQVVEGHGGRVEARSSQEGTTSFTVRVPRGA